MDKIERVRKLLKDIGLPQYQQSNICVLTILGMANLKKKTSWAKATNEWVRIHDIIAFVNNNYDKNYAENSRETFRKQAIHHFRYAAIVEDNSKATNSPDYRYRLTEEFLEILHKINVSEIVGTDIFNAQKRGIMDIPDIPALVSYIRKNVSLQEIERGLLVNGPLPLNQVEEYAKVVMRTREEIKQWVRDDASDEVKRLFGV